MWRASASAVLTAASSTWSAEPVLLALGQHALGDGAVEIVAAQRGVAAGRQHLEHALLQPQQREIEGAAAEIVDRVEAFRALVEAVGQRRRGRLVDQAQHFEAGDARGIAGRGARGIVEIGRHGDDGALDRLVQRRLGARLRSAFRISAEISTGERALPAMRSFTMSVSPVPGSIS